MVILPKSITNVIQLPKLLHITSFEHDSELTECVYIHFLWTNSLHSIRLLNKPLVAGMENGKRGLANTPTLNSGNPPRLKKAIIFCRVD